MRQVLIRYKCIFIYIQAGLKGNATGEPTFLLDFADHGIKPFIDSWNFPPRKPDQFRMFGNRSMATDKIPFFSIQVDKIDPSLKLPFIKLLLCNFRYDFAKLSKGFSLRPGILRRQSADSFLFADKPVA